MSPTLVHNSNLNCVNSISVNLVMDQPEEPCFFEPCPESQAGKPRTRLGPQRIRSIIKASKEVHHDGRHVGLEQLLAGDGNASIFCHWTCVSTYVSSHHLKRSQKRTSSPQVTDDIPAQKRLRRSQSLHFDFKVHCIFCGEVCIMDKDTKNPHQWRRVVLCRTIIKTAGEKTFKESIIDTCNKWNDETSRLVKFRVLSAVSDLHASDVRYHKDCRDHFIPTRNVAAAKTSELQASSTMEAALQMTVTDMEAERSNIWNSVEVFELYISHGGKECSRRTLVSKLCNHFGSDFLEMVLPTC